MNRFKYHIPNAVTSINCLSGVAAIFAASQGESNLWYNISGIHWAFIFIAISALADFLDGFAARALNAYSNLGKELDSLCDLVSFGVAPAMLLFQILGGSSNWLAWCALIIPVCGAVRLAKFNIDDRQVSSFIGLPIPANAIFWIGFTSLYYDLNKAIPEWVTLIAIIGIGFLMISNLRLYSLKFKSWSLKENFMRWCLVFTAILFVGTSGLRGLMWLVLYYITSGVAANLRFRNNL